MSSACSSASLAILSRLISLRPFSLTLTSSVTCSATKAGVPPPIPGKRKLVSACTQCFADPRMEPQRDFIEALTSRARAAIAAAERTVAQSETLAAASRLVTDPSQMVKRCAWCGRLALGRWTSSEEAPRFLAGRLDGQTTHGICSECLRRLERTGRTRPLMHRS
jgi:hypothetical protein